MMQDNVVPRKMGHNFHPEYMCCCVIALYCAEPCASVCTLYLTRNDEGKKGMRHFRDKKNEGTNRSKEGGGEPAMRPRGSEQRL